MPNPQTIDQVGKTPVDKLVLERIYLISSYELERQKWYGLSAHAKIDMAEVVGRGLAAFLDTYMLGLPDQVISIDEQWPKDWWQAFRERWFPKWRLKKHPVRYKTIQIYQKTFKAVCPHMTTPQGDNNVHIEWFAEQASLIGGGQK